MTERVKDGDEDMLAIKRKLAEAARDAAIYKRQAGERKDFLDAVFTLIKLYVPMVEQKYEFHVGPHTTVKVEFKGPIDKEIISNTLAHLAYYAKYFPEKNDSAGDFKEQFRKQLDEALMSLEQSRAREKGNDHE